jgi:hypothetical protein
MEDGYDRVTANHGVRKEINERYKLRDHDDVLRNRLERTLSLAVTYVHGEFALRYLGGAAKCTENSGGNDQELIQIHCYSQQ